MTFEDALKPIYSDLVRYARALAGSSMQGDDLLQEGLVKAWQSYKHLKEPDSFKFWVMRILKNTWRSQQRKQWFKNLLSLDDVPGEVQQDETPLEEKELVRKCLRTLPLNQRETIILYEIWGMSVEEISEVQKVSKSAIKSRLSRGREKLRNAYNFFEGKEEGDGEESLAKAG